jgi:large subunit ribosomal protein L10
MTKQQKSAEIEVLKGVFAENSFFYLADASQLTALEVNSFRRKCFAEGVMMKVAKNTLIRKALESLPSDRNYEGIFDSLHGPTAVLFCETANVPARLIKEFREANNNKPLPELKAAYIDGGIYIGEDQLDGLAKLKSKNELLGEVIGLLQSPAQKVLGQLKSGGNIVAGLVKTLEERAA